MREMDRPVNGNERRGNAWMILRNHVEAFGMAHVEVNADKRLNHSFNYLLLQCLVQIAGSVDQIVIELRKRGGQ